MYNKRGGKVRLTFKLEVDQLWLGTKGKDALEHIIQKCTSFWDMINREKHCLFSSANKSRYGLWANFGSGLFPNG